LASSSVAVCSPCSYDLSQGGTLDAFIHTIPACAGFFRLVNVTRSCVSSEMLELCHCASRDIRCMRANLLRGALTKNFLIWAESRAQVWKRLVLEGFSSDHLSSDVEEMKYSVIFNAFASERIDLWLF
jgi:hypothetical protein